MLIREMAEVECLDALQQIKVGRLACVRDNCPNVVPLHFGYHERRLYAFSMGGQKIDWMRANRQVCVEAGEYTSDVEWLSVVVFGRYEELTDTPKYKIERNFAYEMLRQRVSWWEPAACAVHPRQDASDPPAR